MEIYIDYKNSKNKIELSQAIKVFAINNKDIILKILLDKKEVHTFNEDNNIKIIYELNNNDINLLTFNNDYNYGDLAFTYLKTNDKKRILFTDLSFSSSLNFEEKFNLLKELNFIKEDTTYSIMSIDSLNDVDIDNFINIHQDDKNFLGITIPEKIYETLPDICFTTPLLAHIFISSLKATLNFVNIKNENKEKNTSAFSKLFSSLGSFNETSKKEQSNYLLEDYIIFINKRFLTFKTTENGTYTLYFKVLNNFRDTLLKFNDTKIK